jgi:hypothetical protein
MIEEQGLTIFDLKRLLQNSLIGVRYSIFIFNILQLVCIDKPQTGEGR